MFRSKKRRCKATAAGTWEVKIHVRNIESLPAKYTRLKLEFQESQGNKQLSDEISAIDGKVLLPRDKPLCVWDSACTLYNAADCTPATDQDDLSVSGGSSGCTTGLESSLESKFFSLAILRINTRALLEPQKNIGSTLIDIAQYASRQNLTRTDSVTLLISISNSHPTNVELNICCTWIAGSHDASFVVVSPPSLSFSSSVFPALGAPEQDKTRTFP